LDRRRTFSVVKSSPRSRWTSRSSQSLRTVRGVAIFLRRNPVATSKLPSMSQSPVRTTPDRGSSAEKIEITARTRGWPMRPRARLSLSE
jgi:hypothetical protein